MNARDLYWASLADLPLRTGGTLLDLIRNGQGKRIVDISIGDDTAVDFVAAVACVEPPARAGVTLVYIEWPSQAMKGAAVFGCKGIEGVPDCNPYAGDRDCAQKLPLLCHIDRGLAAPPSNSRWTHYSVTRPWTGGEVAATQPVSGSSFKTIADADAYCAAAFGPGWRAAEWHMGGRGWNLAANGGGRTFAGHHWIDIRNQPYGACWKRNHG
jgi:hypothetical protein